MKPWTEKEIQEAVLSRVSDPGDAEDVAHFCMEVIEDTIQNVCEIVCSHCLSGSPVTDGSHPPVSILAPILTYSIPCYARPIRKEFNQMNRKGKKQ